MTAVAEALEALGVAPGALPAPRLLADLFVRFQAQVPLRVAADLEPEEHLAAWLEEGSGLCGDARVRAFEALATEAGCTLTALVAHGPRAAHRVLLADEGRLLLDPSFPLAAPLPLDPPAEGVSTGYGVLSVKSGADGATEVRLETRGEERLLYRLETGRPEPDAPAADLSESGGTSARGAAPHTDPATPTRAGTRLFRLHDDRLLRWEDGVLDVSDSWSRLRVSFPASDTDGLEALFGPPIPDVASAREPQAVEPTLAVYLASSAQPARLRELLADPATHAALLPDGWSVDALAPHPDGFERTLREEARFLRHEQIALLPDGIRVGADGPLALFATRTWRLEPRAAGTRMRLLATFRDPVPPRGLPDAARRRLVFELASELLALDRFAAER